MSDYEKQRLSSLRANFEALRSAGLPVQPPEFMLKIKSRKEKQKVMNSSLLDSSEGSDEEWTPALERAKKPKDQRKGVFKTIKSSNLENGGHEQTKKSVPSKKRKKRRKQTESNSEDDEIHVYPLRKQRGIRYMSLAIPDDDDFLYCEDCNLEYDGDCPEHGPLVCVYDVQVPDSFQNGSTEFCRKTLPEGLAIRKSKIPNAGLGVFAVKDFPARTRFGPYKGRKELDEEIAHELGYSWQILKDGKPSHFVDGRDPSDSNWMRFVNCARCEDEQCVTAYQYKGEVYYRSYKHISAGTEILVYYGDSYAADLGIQIQKFGTLSKKVPGRETIGQSGVHPCSQCQLSFCKVTDVVSIDSSGYEEKAVKLNGADFNDKLIIQNDGSSRELSKVFNVPDKQIELSMSETRLETWSNTQSDRGRHTVEKAYMCNICCTEFSYHSQLKMHERVHTGEKPYKCDVCSVGFTRHDDLKRHKRIHTGEKPYKCDVCSVGFTNSSDLKQHKRTHTGEKPYKCDVCSVRFTNSSDLKKHKRIHTGEKPYKCDVCSVRFTQHGHLKQHKRTHTGEKPYKCDVCSVRFTQHGHLKQHKRTHTGEKPYKCDVCSVRFTHHGNLKKHKRTHTGEKPYKCDVCSVRFTQHGHLKQHKRTHTGEKPYKCDVCSVRFTHHGNLKRHKRTHTGEKPYKCDVCSVRFTQHGSLKKHKRTHTGEKPYKCDVCSVRFTQHGSLKKHKRTHTGEKPYKCDVCSVRFTQHGSLKQHKRSHTGEKPYKCDVCNALFTWSKQLQKHKVTHTGNK